MKIGVFPGKFLPPHRGHLTGILRAHALCDRLFVVVCEREEDDRKLCESVGCRFAPGWQRQRWLIEELEGLDITVLRVSEEGIEPFPFGWNDWAERVRQRVGMKFDVIFGGEEDYRSGHAQAFPGVEYTVLDPSRSTWPVSGTIVRANIYKHWLYIIGPARGFFAQRVLVTGPESSGKSTMVKKLAKVFYTSWAEEYGRTYQENFLQGRSDLFRPEDFLRILEGHRKEEEKALRTANRVAFFDTDAVVTQFFAEFTARMYDVTPRREWAEIIHACNRWIEPQRYDHVLFLMPTVRWVDDGMRETGSTDEERMKVANQLLARYTDKGFDFMDMSIITDSSYVNRLDTAIARVQELIK
jgi:HTH-type transcriptional repressor of NAD biosynthesis genes